MPKTLQFEMITPEKVALKTTAEFVVLPAVKGEMGVLPGHEAYLVQLDPGEVRVTAEGEQHFYAIAGGFAEVFKDKVSVFAETADMAQEIDAEKTRQELEKAKAQATKAGLDPLTLAAAEGAIRVAMLKLRVAELRKGGGRTRAHHQE
ncbi:MAG: ATP synthase F1 subunit epsilon [Proteobacteria bacterium]|nr:ATP synthase F1 subunit epsilon [Pseudomonadota bacterium]